MKLLATFILMLLLGQGPCSQAAHEFLADYNLQLLESQTDLPYSNSPATDREAADTFDDNLEDNLDFNEYVIVTFLSITEPERGNSFDNSLLMGCFCPPFLPPEALKG